MKDIGHSIGRFTLIGGALAAALAASDGAEAQQHIIATAANLQGGEILMTSVMCGTGREVLSLTPGGQVTDRGCASPLLPDRLYIRYDSGHTYVVPRSYFATTAPAASAPRAEFAVRRAPK